MYPVPLRARRHVVKPGESLDLIARQNGYREWRVIYLSRCNDQLRKLRLDPNAIRPGDLVMLPPRVSDIRSVLQLRLQRLRALRQDAGAQFDDLQRELESQFLKIDRFGSGVDVIAEVLLILNGLGRMCWRGFQALEKGGEELAAANKELTREAIDFIEEPVGNIVLKTFADQINNPKWVRIMNPVWLFSAAVVRAWLDVGSPSYWANVVSQYRGGASLRTALTHTPADIRAGAGANIKRTRRRALAEIDARIRDTERLLGEFRGEVATPLPMKKSPLPAPKVLLP